jgi:CPA2 family monovalent cation:H+ antiporter-2
MKTLNVSHSPSIPAAVGYGSRAGYALQLRRSALLVVAGILLGPHVFDVFQNSDVILTIAHGGALVLFFSMGAQFSAATLRTLGENLGVTLLECGIVIGAAAVSFRILGLSWFLALLGGAIIAFSYPETSRICPARPGAADAERKIDGVIRQRAILALLCLLLVAPGSGELRLGGAFVQRLVVTMAVMGVLVLFVQKGISGLIWRLDRQHGRIFSRTASALLALSIVWMAFASGLQIGAGAFLAGCALSGTRSRVFRRGELDALHAAATVALFISLGMLLNLSFVLSYPLLMLAGVGCVLMTRAAANVVWIRTRSLRSTSLIPLITPFGASGLLLFYAGVEAEILVDGALSPVAEAYLSGSALALLSMPVLDALRGDRNAHSDLHAKAGRPHLARSRGSSVTVRLGSILRTSGSRGYRRCRLYALEVEPGCYAEGQSIDALHLPKRFNVETVSVWRGDVYCADPAGTYRLDEGDHIVLSGRSLDVARTLPLFEADTGEW